MFLEGISDATIVALAENCPKLEILDIKDCHEVRRDGILAFSSHQCLKSLVLLGLWDFDLFDVESIALGCPSLESVVVDSSLRVDPAWSSELMHEHTKKSHQVLDSCRPFFFWHTVQFANVRMCVSNLLVKQGPLLEFLTNFKILSVLCF